MVRLREQFGGNMSRQLLFGLERCTGAPRKTDSCRNTKHVGIDRHYKFVVNDCTNDICSLTTHSWQSLQFVDIVGHNAPKFAHQHTRHSGQIFRLVVWV